MPRPPKIQPVVTKLTKILAGVNFVLSINICPVSYTHLDVYKRQQYVWIPSTTEDSKSQLQFKRTEWDVEVDGADNSRASKDELTLTCPENYSDNGLTLSLIHI